MLVSVQQDCSCAGAGSLFCRLPAAVPQHFFKAHRGELKTHRHGAWKLPPTSPPGYKFMQSKLTALQQFPQKQTGNSRFAVPQRNFSNPTNWVERTRSTAATLPKSSRIWKNQIRSTATARPRSPEFAVANSQRLNAPPNPSRIWQSQIRSAAAQLLKFAAPQRFSVAASRLPNTARRRG